MTAPSPRLLADAAGFAAGFAVATTAGVVLTVAGWAARAAVDRYVDGWRLVGRGLVGVARGWTW